MAHLMEVKTALNTETNLGGGKVIPEADRMAEPAPLSELFSGAL